MDRLRRFHPEELRRIKTDLRLTPVFDLAHWPDESFFDTVLSVPDGLRDCDTIFHELAGTTKPDGSAFTLMELVERIAAGILPDVGMQAKVLAMRDAFIAGRLALPRLTIIQGPRLLLADANHRAAAIMLSGQLATLPVTLIRA